MLCALLATDLPPNGDYRTIQVFLRLADDGWRMASLYFCQPHTQNQGMLRAILNREDCQHLAAPGNITYVGQEFPTLANGQPQERDFAVLKVDADEGDALWRPGFYRVDADLMELNSVLLTLAR
jgi:hypothetical protein